MRVGVTGHRELPAEKLGELRKQIDQALACVDAIGQRSLRQPGHGYDTKPPVLRVISSLAAGADQLVAELALERGFELQCPLPFARDEYRKDFDEAAGDRFDRLTDQAGAVFELDGARDREGQAYEAAGLLMLDHSDVLIAIWDGEDIRGRGGTAQIAEEALRIGVPTIWLDPEGRHAPRASLAGGRQSFEPFDPDRFAQAVAQAMAPPEPHGANNGRAAFFAETRPLFRPSILLGVLWDRVYDVLTAGGGSARDAGANPSATLGRAIEPYRRSLRIADFLAGHYTRLYRGSALANYLLAALAVSFAISLLLVELTQRDGHGGTWRLYALLSGEFLSVLLVVLITVTANRHAWHTRSIDYRFLAEQLRQMEYLAPLGLITPESRPPIYHADGDPRSTWMTWYFRSIVREAGLPTASVTREYLAACVDWLRAGAVRGQLSYQKRTADRMHRFHHRLHRLGMALFCLTGGAIMLHLILLPLHDVEALHWLAERSGWLTVVSALTPAWGGAILAILSHGEYERVEKRAMAMRRHLEELDQQLAAIDLSRGSTGVRRLASSMARSLIDEVVDWRIVFAARPVRPPA